MSDNPVMVVLDTNVLIAAYWAPESASARIIRACMEGSVRAIYTLQVRREADRMLKQIRVSEDYLKWLEQLWSSAVEVEPLPVDDVPIDDPDDRKFLEAAAGGEADFIVTNDDHLLSVGYLGRAEILTPGSFVRLIPV
jgi:putative PIN family toxin of toxin-antitoxin system